MVHFSAAACFVLVLIPAAGAQGPYNLIARTGSNCFVMARYTLCCGIPGGQSASQSIPSATLITSAGVGATASIPQGSMGILTIDENQGRVRMSQACTAGFPSGPAITEGWAGFPSFDNEVVVTITGTGPLVTGVLGIAYSGSGSGTGACSVDLPGTGLPGFQADSTRFRNALLGVAGTSPIQVVIKAYAYTQGVYGPTSYSQLLVVDFHPAEAPLIATNAPPCGADLTASSTFDPLTRSHTIRRALDHGAPNAVVFDILGATPIQLPIPGSLCTLFTDILVLPGNVLTDASGHTDLVPLELPWDLRGTFYSQAVLVTPSAVITATNPLAITGR